MLSSPVSLSMNYSLSFLSFPLLVHFDGVSYISVLHLLSRTSFCPDIPLTHTSSHLLQWWKQMKTGLSLLRPFSMLSFIFAPSHFLPLPVSLSPSSVQAPHSTQPSFDLLLVFELPVSLIFQSRISTLWKLRSEISLFQLPHCWVKPNVTPEISFRATWQSKLRHPAFAANDQVSEPVERIIYTVTLWGCCWDDSSTFQSQPLQYSEWKWIKNVGKTGLTTNTLAGTWFQATRFG